MENRYVYMGDLGRSLRRIDESFRDSADDGRAMYATTRKQATQFLLEHIETLQYFAAKKGLPVEISIKSVEIGQSNLSAKSPRQAMHELYAQFTNLSYTSMPTELLEQCKDIIVIWFNKRFSYTDRDPHFQYNLNNFNSWLDWFIIAIGYSIKQNKLDALINDINEWFEDGMTSPDGSGRTYPLPYAVKIVGQFDPSKSEDNITPESIVIEKYIKESLYTFPDYHNKRATIYNRWHKIWGYNYTSILSASSIK